MALSADDQFRAGSRRPETGRPPARLFRRGWFAPPVTVKQLTLAEDQHRVRIAIESPGGLRLLSHNMASDADARHLVDGRRRGGEPLWLSLGSLGPWLD